MRFSKYHIIFLIILAGIGLFFLESYIPKSSPQIESNKVRVTATFYPLAEFTRNVGDGLVDVKTITPPGAEPHDYEPSPQDIVSINSSQLFVMNGNGVDSWGDKIKNELEAKGIHVIRMSDVVHSVENTDSTALNADPHFWLDPIYAEAMVQQIKNSLIKIDPIHKDIYNKNASAYIGQLAKLNEEYKTGLSSCKENQIVVSHNAFNYLAARYHIKVLYLSGLSPDEEPSPKRMAEIATIAKDQHIQYIFYETLISPKLSDTIAKEIGAKTLVLNPLEGLTAKDIQAGNNYISIMKENLSNLQKALICTQ